jgi:hypothetical protein
LPSFQLGLVIHLPFAEAINRDCGECTTPMDFPNKFEFTDDPLGDLACRPGYKLRIH